MLERSYWELARVRSPVRSEGDRQIHLYGNCVVVTLKVDAAGIYNNQAFSENLRFTRVWVQRQNRWQIVAGHVSQVIPL